MTNGYNYKCINVGAGEFILTWNYGVNYGEGNIAKKKAERRVDEAAARRFCKKANITFPVGVSRPY